MDILNTVYLTGIVPLVGKVSPAEAGDMARALSMGGLPLAALHIKSAKDVAQSRAMQQAVEDFLICACGVKDEAGIACREPFVWLDTKGSDLGMVEKTLRLPEEAQAPVEAGQKAGEAVYRLDGRTLGTVDVVYTESVAAAGLGDYLKKVLAYFLL